MRRPGAVLAVLALLVLGFGGWLLPERPRPAPPQPPSAGPTGLPDLLPERLRPDRPPPRPSQSEGLTSPISRIVVEKAARRMTVHQERGPARTYRIALGFAPDGDKLRQGDGRTPEGVFRIDRLNRESRFHLSLGLDYPQPRHRQAARRGGYDPGGDIMIHGQPPQVPAGHRVKGDWTAGCIALSDAEMDEVFAMARIGTEVEIRP